MLSHPTAIAPLWQWNIPKKSWAIERRALPPVKKVLHYILFWCLCYQTRSVYWRYFYTGTTSTLLVPPFIFRWRRVSLHPRSRFRELLFNKLLVLILESGQHNRCSIHLLHVSRSRGWTPNNVTKLCLLQNAQTGSGAHPASCTRR